MVAQHPNNRSTLTAKRIDRSNCIAAEAAAEAATGGGATLRNTLTMTECNDIKRKILRGKDLLTGEDIVDLQSTRHPFFNRQEFNRTASATPNFVRYVGMVQDMLEPEYYVSRVHGRHTHYMDFVNTASDGDGDDAQPSQLCNDLEERTPLIIVPIPHTAPWFRDELNGAQRLSPRNTTDIRDGNNNNNNDNNSGRSSSNDKKRHRDAEASMEEHGDGNADANATANTNESSNTSTSADAQQSARKRDASWQGSPGEDPEMSDGHQRSATASANGESNSKNEWWPSGTQNSCPTQIPILAKMYYSEQARISAAIAMSASSSDDQSSVQRKLRLNDVVECIGIVSNNPLDVDFSNQTTGRLTGNGGDHVSNSDRDYDDANLAMFDNSTDLFLEDHIVLPPPSLLPRMHVVSYRVLDLDDSDDDAWDSTDATTEQDQQQQQHQQQQCVEGEGALHTSSVAEPSDQFNRQDMIECLATALNESKVTAEAILMTLFSLAQRKETVTPLADNDDDSRGIAETATASKPLATTSWECITTPFSTTLGCASLNLQLASPSTITQCQQLSRKLHDVLAQVVPVVALLDLPNCTTVTNNDPSRFNVPKKLDGRMQPSVLQLPKGSTIIINMGDTNLDHELERNQDGCTNQDAKRRHELLQVIRQLMKSHTVPYVFQGSFYTCAFEADYRVLVVSTIAMPCTMHTTCSVKVEQPSISVQRPSLDLRAYIASGRRRCTNVEYAPALLRQAQEDFIQRRQSARQQDKPGITETDFHRWLTITKLQAQSRGKATPLVVADLEDWKDALRLDDAMRST